MPTHGTVGLLSLQQWQAYHTMIEYNKLENWLYRTKLRASITLSCYLLKIQRFDLDKLPSTISLHNKDSRFGRPGLLQNNRNERGHEERFSSQTRDYWCYKLIASSFAAWLLYHFRFPNTEL
ncbi:hypothetical protein Tco_1187273 [Tanacetum coccineum]